MHRYIGAGKGNCCCLLIIIVSFLSDLEFIAFRLDSLANRWQAVWTRFCSLRLSSIQFMFSLFIYIHGAFACGRCQLMHNTNNNEKVKEKKTQNYYYVVFSYGELIFIVTFSATIFFFILFLIH